MPKAAVRASCLLFAPASSCRSLARAEPCFSRDLEVLELDVPDGLCARGTGQIRTAARLLAWLAALQGCTETCACCRARATWDPVLYPVGVFPDTCTAWAPWSRDSPLQTASVPHPLTWASSLWRIPECFHIPPTRQGTEPGKRGHSPFQMERKHDFPSDACLASCWTSFLRQFASGAATAKSSAVGRGRGGTGQGLAAAAYTVQTKFLLLW